MNKKLYVVIALSLGLGMVMHNVAHASINTTSYDHSQYISSGIVTKTDPNGNRIQYTYDAVNNLTQMGLPDAPGGAVNYGYSYDLTDQLETITYPEGSQQFAYDDLDRLVSITVNEFNSTGPLLDFSYDHQDRITWITYPGNGEVCYEYDPDGRITRVGRSHTTGTAQCSGASEKTDYSYDAKGRLASITYPNGLSQYRSYHTDTGLLKEVGYKYSNGTLLYSDSYEYIPFTRLYHKVIRKMATGSKTTEYGYDAYERVTSVLEPSGRKTVFEYDPFGNRLKETITNVNDANASGGSPRAYGEYQYIYPDKSNRLDKINYQPPGTAVFVLHEDFSYDAAGRITSRTDSTGTTAYTFDDRGLMINANMADGTVIAYSYDALGNRRAKTVNGATTNYLTAPIFGMSHVLAELAEDMTIKSSYVYAGPQLLKEEPSTTDRSKDLYMLHEGKVGSITHTVDMNGSIRNEYDYDTFGTRSNVRTASTGSNQHFGYTGEMFDEESGLLYLRARYYDPSIGRFISADPYLGRMAEPVTQNRYIYVHNNPLLYADPSGMCVGPLIVACANAGRYLAQNAPGAIISAGGTFAASYASNGGDWWAAGQDALVAGGTALIIPSVKSERVFTGMVQSASGNAAAQVININIRETEEEFDWGELGIATAVSIPANVYRSGAAALGVGEMTSAITGEFIVQSGAFTANYLMEDFGVPICRN